jgi:hypothetical protein
VQLQAMDSFSFRSPFQWMDLSAGGRMIPRCLSEDRCH